MSAERDGPSGEAGGKGNPGSRRPAVFLDRDGTINVEVDHLSRPEELRLLPDAARAIARLRSAGCPVVVVTNQSAVARGLLTEAELSGIHREFERLLREQGTGVDAIYYCPHHPEFGSPAYRRACACRKPGPGLLRRAALEHGLDLERSFMVGDRLSDLQAGWNAGCRVVLVLTGYGEETRREVDPGLLRRVDFIAGDLGRAAEWILRRL